MPLLAELAVRVEKSFFLNDKKHPVCDLFPGELELWLSFLLDDHPWLTEAENESNKQRGLHALSVIGNLLFVAEFTMARVACPEWFAKYVEYWHSKRASVLTLNYDSLVERCAVSLNIDCRELYPVPLISLDQSDAGADTGARGQTFALFKMHGSGSWFYPEAEPPAKGPIYYFPYRSWGDQVEDSQVLVKGKVPFVVPPRFNKATYFRHETMHQLWGMAGEALRSADRIFVLGYSLPPTDLEMRYFLATNARRNEQKIYVADTNPKVVERFVEVFGKSYVSFNVCGIDDMGPIPPLGDALYSGRL